MSKFYCIGDIDTCAGFGLAGVKGCTPKDYDEAIDVFNTVLHDLEVSILIITEEIAGRLQDNITTHRVSGKMPMIVEIPENLSSEFKGQSLMDSIRQAIGISL